MIVSRVFLVALTLIGSILAQPLTAHAQDYPTKPIRWVVPFPPGGAMDVMARTLAQKMPDSMGQQLVIDNRPGAGGIIGSDLVAKAAPDGYTVVLQNCCSELFYAYLSAT